MNDFFEHLSADLKELAAKGKSLLSGKGVGGRAVTATVKTNYEINLVPQVKMQMIKAQKTRNIVLFVCILVSSVAAGAVVVLFGIKSGQDITMAGQDARLEEMSEKLNAYNELDSLVTIQGQLSGIDNIIAQKTVLSRVFGALGVMLPTGADSVALSELNVNLETNLIRMEGQADAHSDPLIDYRVLESFKKGVALTKYDYGRYVDVEGVEIPTHCIKETDSEGNAYRVGDSYYAWWDLTIEGCEASQRGGTAVEGAKYAYSSTAEVEKGVPGEELKVEMVCDENGENCVEQVVGGEVVDPNGEIGEGIPEGEGRNELVPVRVKIWRTPQFTKWYEAGRMQLDGAITGIEHFETVCYKYSGTVVPATNTGTGTGSNSTSNKPTVRWTSLNDCMLAPGGLTVTESANARDQSGNLVLKFAGNTVLAEAFFSYNNKHMMAIGPMGQNVTDSYVQISSMFTKEAVECEEDDTECLSDSKNQGGNNGEQ